MSNEDEKKLAAARIAELNAERDDLIAQRQACDQDIARCNRELSRPTFREHADIVKEQRRESGIAISRIDSELGRVRRELNKLDHFCNNNLSDYFMEAARDVVSADVFARIKMLARMKREAHLAFVHQQPTHP